MKAFIEKIEGFYIIRIRSEEGTLQDIHVVDEIILFKPEDDKVVMPCSGEKWQ